MSLSKRQEVWVKLWLDTGVMARGGCANQNGDETETCFVISVAHIFDGVKSMLMCAMSGLLHLTWSYILVASMMHI